MRQRGEYTIPFSGLSIGRHEFQFELGNTFFELYDYSEIHECQISINVVLEKQNNMMTLEFDIEGNVVTLCDRCTELVDLQIHSHEILVVKFGPESGHPDEEVLILGPQEYQLDLTHFLYEYSHLALPAKRVHDNLEACNQDVIKLLHGDGEVEDSNEPVDPRWEKLKGLEDKNKENK